MSRAAREEALSAAPAPLRALRAGPLAAGALALGPRGRVAAVNRRAWFARLDGGELVALLPPGTPLHPWALTLSALPPPPEPGVPVAVADGVLALGAARIALAGLEVAPLALGRVAPPDAARCARLVALAGGPAPGDAFGVALDRALAAFGRGEAAALGALIGLGPGLTPSGDDVVVGVLAALEALAGADRRAAALRTAVVSTVEDRLAERTTRLSAQLVAAAVRGLYAEPVLEVLAALDPGSPADLAGAVGRLSGVGGRSGRDTLAGLAAALRPAAPAAGERAFSGVGRTFRR